MRDQTNSSLSPIPVDTAEPPEELLTIYAGGFGRWQLCVVVFSFLAILFHSLDLYTSKAANFGLLNYTCGAPNATKCFDGNGTPCEEFTYYRINDEIKIVTFAEKFNLVCEKELWHKLIKICFHIGMIFGYFVSGWSSDKFGQKVTAIGFISFHCMFGVFMITVKELHILIVFILCQGLFSTYICMFPKIVVCESMGNKWRTLMLSIINLPFSFSPVLVPPLFMLNVGVDKLTAFVSTIPLILLLPLLFFKDSPTSFLSSADFKRLEKKIRKIAKINNKTVSNELRIRPVNFFDTKPNKHVFCGFFHEAVTRYAFLALIAQYFFSGYGYDILLGYMYDGFLHLYLFACGGLFGALAALMFCHFMNHRLLLVIFNFMKNVLLLGTFLVDVESAAPNFQIVICITMMASFFVFGSILILDNLAIRMYPTDSRGRGLGLSYAIFSLGSLTAFAIFDFLRETKSLFICLAFCSLICETVSCFWLWDVHNRELPDYLEDSVNFQKFYKPIRYSFFQRKETDYIEKEMIAIDLDSTSKSSMSI